MTELLQQAFDRASELSEKQQDEFARFCSRSWTRNGAGTSCSTFPNQKTCWASGRMRPLDAHRAGCTLPLDRPTP